MEFSFDKGQRSPNTLNNKPKSESDPFAEARSQHQSSRPQASAAQFSNENSGQETSAEDRLRKAIERNRQKQQMQAGQQQPAAAASAAPHSATNNDDLARKRAEQEAQIRAQFEAQQRAKQEAQLRAQYEEQQRTKSQDAEKAQMQARQLAEAEARLRQAQAEQRARQEARLRESQTANIESGTPEQGALFGERPTMMNRQTPPVQPEVLSRQTASASKEAPRESLAARLNALNNKPAPQVNPKPAPQTSPEVDPLEKKITSKAVVTRQRVARVEDEFTTPVKKTPRKVTTPAYINKKSGALDPKWQNILVKGSWIFCGLMLVRLFFSQGGILDFYDQSKVLTDKKLELEQIRSENMALTREISRMQSDTGYQKKIVRDNLGFIAQDEFLILFPKEI